MGPQNRHRSASALSPDSDGPCSSVRVSPRAAATDTASGPKNVWNRARTTTSAPRPSALEDGLHLSLKELQSQRVGTVGFGPSEPDLSSSFMATVGTAGQSRRKKNPGLMDQFCKLFGGEKKKRSRVSRTGPDRQVLGLIRTSARSH